MVVEAVEENMVQTLRHAHEAHDVDLALSLYAEHAEVRVVDHANPPDSPKVFRGRKRIAGYLRRLYDPEITHGVGAALQDVVVGEGRIPFNVRSEYAQGDRLLASESYEVHKGKIVHQTNVQVS